MFTLSIVSRERLVAIGIQGVILFGHYSAAEAQKVPSARTTTVSRLGARDVSAGSLIPANFVDIRSSGAVCDGITDDTANINALLSSLQSAVVVVPENSFCLIGSGNLNDNNNIKIIGQGMVVATNGVSAGTGFILNPFYTINLGSPGAELADLTIRRQGLIPNPSTSQATAAIQQWANEISSAVTILPNQAGVSVNDVFIEGFNTAITTKTGEFDLRHIFLDTINGVEVLETGDYGTIFDVRMEPFYTISLAKSTWFRPGIGLELLGADGVVDRFVSCCAWAYGIVSWAGDWVISNSRVEWSIFDGLGGATGIRQLAESSPRISASRVVTYEDPVSLENDYTSTLSSVWADSATTAGPDFYLSGQASPSSVTLQVGGSVAAGNTLSVTFSGSSPSLNATASYTEVATDSVTSAAVNLALAIDRVRALSAARIGATAALNGANAGTATVYWPITSNISVVSSATGGASITQTVATSPPQGSKGLMSAITTGSVSTIPLIQSNRNTMSWTLSGLHPAGGQVAPGWLQVGSPATGVFTLDNIPWSLVTAAGNLTFCGTSPSMVTPSNDGDGTVVEGTNATGCTLTFTTPFFEAPTCTLASPTGTAVTSYATTPTSLVITNPVSSNGKLVYHCRPL